MVKRMTQVQLEWTCGLQPKIDFVHSSVLDVKQTELQWFCNQHQVVRDHISNQTL